MRQEKKLRLQKLFQFYSSINFVQGSLRHGRCKNRPCIIVPVPPLVVASPLHGQMVQAVADVVAPVPDRWLGKAVVAQMCSRWESPQYQAGDNE